MNGENPFSDGRIRGRWDAIVRAIVIALALFVAWHVPIAWYWRIALFFAFIFVIGIIYPAAQMALAIRRERRLINQTKPVDPAYEQLLELYPEAKAQHENTREIQARLNAMSKAYRKNSD